VTVSYACTAPPLALPWFLLPQPPQTTTTTPTTGVPHRVGSEPPPSISLFWFASSVMWRSFLRFS